MKTNEEIIKKFDGFVKELNTTQEFIRNKNSLIYKFGYKTLKGDEIFTVVDWGNIRKCILELLSQQKQEIVDEIANYNIDEFLKKPDNWNGWSVERQLGYNFAAEQFRQAGKNWKPNQTKFN